MQWITKLKSANLSDADISITKTKSKEGKIRFCVRFRNTSFNKITTNRKIVYAVNGKRIYFKQGDGRNGFSLNSFNVDNTSCSTMFSLLDDEHAGDYMLEYDKAEKLYYIDINKKIVR